MAYLWADMDLKELIKHYRIPLSMPEGVACWRIRAAHGLQGPCSTTQCLQGQCSATQRLQGRCSTTHSMEGQCPSPHGPVGQEQAGQASAGREPASALSCVSSSRQAGQATAGQASVGQCTASRATAEETPALEAPIIEAPIIEAPIIEAPIIEVPIIEAPIIEAPIIEAHCMLLVTGGELTVSVAGRRQTVRAGMFVDAMGASQGLRLLAATADIEARALLVSDRFLQTFFHHRPPFSHAYVDAIRRNPVLVVPGGEGVGDGVVRLARAWDGVEQAIAQTQHVCHREMLDARIAIFLMEVADVFAHHPDASTCGSRGGSQTNAQVGSQTGSKVGSRVGSQALLEAFTQLLHTHIGRAHTVAFYADRLCVTPQYLGRVLRQHTGKSVAQTIDEELLRQTLRMILETDLTMQAIADAMGFSSQAALTAFVKRLTGASPMQHRKQSTVGI